MLRCLRTLSTGFNGTRSYDPIRSSIFTLNVRKLQLDAGASVAAHGDATLG